MKHAWLVDLLTAIITATGIYFVITTMLGGPNWAGFGFGVTIYLLMPRARQKALTMEDLNRAVRGVRPISR